MTIYILNTLIVPVNFDEEKEVKIVLVKMTVGRAKTFLRFAKEKDVPIVSAVGHEATAKLLSKLLGTEISCERKNIYMKPGDIGIHFFLKQRLPEGKILSEEELQKLDYWLVLSRVI
ncbi:MAG: DUF1874 domain-containing protein [Thermoproteota archaeon]